MMPFLLLAAGAFAPIRFHYDSSEWANATYHLACLESRIRCSDSIYERYWIAHSNAVDARHIKTFAQAMDRIEAAQPQPQAAPLFPNYGWPHPAIRKRAEVIAAAVNANSAGECNRSLSLIVPASDAQIIASAIEHVRRTLHPWWIRQGRPAATAFLRNIGRASRGAGMEALARQVAGFLEVPLRGRDVWLHVVPSPEPKNRQASGTFAGNHFFMEITNETKPRDAAWVALHELTHALYEDAPAAKHRALMDQFAEHPDGQPFYALLNEALATAVQLIVFERLNIDDGNAYNHPYIPRLARSVLPIFKRAIEEHESIFEGFATRYLRAGRAELGDDVQDVRFAYSAVAVLASETNQRASQAFLEAIRPTCFTTSEADWKRYKGLPAVRLVTEGEPVSDDGARVVKSRDRDELVEAVRRLRR